MITLAIDTSTERGTVALGNGKDLLQFTEFQGPMRHSSTLFPALAEFKLATLKVGRIIVGLGPGSFSGIRVGLAAAHGIAFAHDAEVVGICSAWSIAYQFQDIAALGVFADARRGEFYCTACSKGRIIRATYLFSRELGEAEAGKYDLAVSAEPLAGISNRAFPKASDYLNLPTDSDIFIRDSFLEPIYLREPVSSSPNIIQHSRSHSLTIQSDTVLTRGGVRVFLSL